MTINIMALIRRQGGEGMPAPGEKRQLMLPILTKSVDGDKQNWYFDETVPVEEIKIANPEVEDLSEDEYEVVSPVGRSVGLPLEARFIAPLMTDP